MLRTPPGPSSVSALASPEEDPRAVPPARAQESGREGGDERLGEELEPRLRRRLAALLPGRRTRVLAFVLASGEGGAAAEPDFACLRFDENGGAERRLHAGNPADVISRCAAEDGDALIALVTDPADGFEHLYRTSVALEVMQRCGAAVLLLPLPTAAGKASRPG